MIEFARMGNAFVMQFRTNRVPDSVKLPIAGNYAGTLPTTFHPDALSKDFNIWRALATDVPGLNPDSKSYLFQAMYEAMHTKQIRSLDPVKKA